MDDKQKQLQDLKEKLEKLFSKEKKMSRLDIKKFHKERFEKMYRDKTPEEAREGLKNCDANIAAAEKNAPGPQHRSKHAKKLFLEQLAIAREVLMSKL